MLQAVTFPIRTECPPGSCVCERDALLADPDGDTRVLRLTRMEERKLILRIESIASYGDLRKMGERIEAQLGITLTIAPGIHEVRTVRGIVIALAERPGLCKKLHQSIPAAVRRCLDQHPDIVYAILNAHDLLGAS